jgi:Flp pilus assembly protein TadG
MRQRRLLNRSSEAGSAPVEFVFGAVFVTLLLFGVIEVAFALYGRNVIASSAHEAARAAVELHGVRDPETVARSTVERAAGGLIDSYDVAVSSQRSDERMTVQVRVLGRLDPPGPLPLKIPVDLTATSVRETLP